MNYNYNSETKIATFYSDSNSVQLKIDNFHDVFSLARLIDDIKDETVEKVKHTIHQRFKRILDQPFLGVL